MHNNLYRYTFKTKFGDFVCQASGLPEAMKHLERATGLIEHDGFEVEHIYRDSVNI
jgi:hypothetical protein